MNLVWREDMGLGHGTIDRDHRYLMELVNRLGAVSEIEGGQDFGHMLERFTAFARDHFCREENMMRVVRYPFYDSHQREHVHLLRKLTAQRESMAAPGCAADRTEFVRFLSSWLMDHIFTADLRIKPYVAPLLRQQAASRTAGSHRGGLAL